MEDKTASSLKICSFNATSIGKNPRRGQIFHFLKKKRADIFILADTRIDKDIEKSVRNEWGGEAVFNSFNSRSRGVAIFFLKGLIIKIGNSISDEAGNMLALELEYSAKKILLVGLYGPNTDSPQFYSETLFPVINNSDADYVIIGGDWNLTLDQSVDTFNYLHVNNPRAKQVVNEKIDEGLICDSWRELNPYSKMYTWTKKNPIKMARLDFFLTSTHLIPYISKQNISPGFLSDHSIIEITIDFDRVKVGKGFFKFNNSLLKDTTYTDSIKIRIKEVTRQYLETPIDDNFWDTLSMENIEHLDLNINPQLFFEVLLLEIRGLTINYSSRLKRRKNLRFNFLSKEISDRTHSVNDDPDPVVQDQLDNLKFELEELVREQAEGAALRSKAIYNLEGERPTRYFCNLEKNTACQKYISRLQITSDQGTRHVTHQGDVEKEMLKFYKELYRSRDEDFDETKVDSFLIQQLRFS